MSWWGVLPGIVLMAGLWLAPGYLFLRALGVRGLLALGAGGGVTSGLAGVLAIGFDKVGVTWSLVTFLIGCLAAILIALGVGRLLRTTRDPAGEVVAGTRRLARSERGWLAVTGLVGGGVLSLAMMTGMQRADMPLQVWDAVYHLNALWFIQDTGNASSLGSLAPMYADTASPYYPTVWHSIVAIAPGFENVTQAANASSIVLGTAVWMASLVALSRVVWPARALPVVLTPIVAATFVTFPAVSVSMLGVWPFAVSVAALPGALALMIAALRGNQTWQIHLAHALGFAAAAAGVVLAHGSGLFSLALLAAPLLGVLLFRQGRRYWRRGHQVPVAIAGVLLVTVVVLGTIVLLNFQPVQAILDYQRGGQESYWPGIGSLLIDHPLIYVYDIKSVNLVITAMAIVGICLTISRKHARWLVVALLAAAVLTLLAAGPPENPIRALAGFWYTQASRINQLFVIPMIVLAAGGLAWICRALADRLRLPITGTTAVVLVGVALATFGLRWPTQVEVMSSVYSNWPIAWGTMIDSEDELAMIDRADEVLPDDAVVLGEPVNGSSYLLARSDVSVVYPQLTTISGSPERELLAQEFNKWYLSPEVCQAVTDLGVTHVYADDLTFEEGGKWEETTPGLRIIDTSRPGFELVDEGGQASLWRFTGCDDREEVSGSGT
ncbi:hypothetical protein NF556_09395 [Ornithinimicrobium faecis]|uniref:Uncharacterized protein n=1 Tax=Ornithinimicrobium faecis TaxID=2934158 RepID=A0ABY4YZG4_9MICO|nr:DUF6541 family protein [Ornithinimicrobium sp. HY1793]USQ81840.1 hypothetical protein NF556_09395 [Ornithinimicrobium sp. HY1793]